MSSDQPSSTPPHAPLLSLSRNQEQRLRDYLDERLLNLERDDRKLALGPLSALVARLTPILHLILQIPAREPWNSTRVAYLLNFTAVAVTYITALPLVHLPKRKRGDKEEEDQSVLEAQWRDEAGRSIRCLLDLLQETERGWIAVLRGKAWVQGPGGGCAVDIDGAGTVDTTARVRLKSIVDIGREKILAWARPYGHFGGEVMGQDGEEGQEVPEEEKSGWEAEVVNTWKGILKELDWDGTGA